MDDLIGERQICQSILVHTVVKVVIISREGLSQPVVVVDHRGYTVETKTIEMVFLRPVAAVRQQEVQHCRFTVVKTPAVPRRMLAAMPLVEILIRRSVEHRNAFDFIFYRMRVHEIDDDRHPHAVRGIYERLEFLRCTEPRRGCEEAADVISERSIVGMFQHSH